MSTLHLLYERQYAINDKISIVIPTVGEIAEDEDSYYSIISVLTSMPIDYMVALDDAGIDFTEINEYELFIIMFSGLKSMNTKLVFGDLDLSKFEIMVNGQNNMVVLRDEENDITIDRAIHGQIAMVLREIHHLEKNRRKPANKEAKSYMLERARMKARRNRNRKQKSQLESLIVAMVNAPEFKYDFDTVRDITIYQFNESVRQVIKRVDVDHRMIGIYSGTVSAKDMKQDDLNWLVHK